MERLKLAPATHVLIAINLVVFAINYFTIGTLNDPYWTVGLLESGALFNPYTLNGQRYRIFTHMFMHGGIIHLFVNMYGLYVLGIGLEAYTGTKKFALVYFVTGVAAALASLSFGIFTIGVGASGAIFGVYGFGLIVNIQRHRESELPLGPLFINFILLLLVNLAISKSVHADNAAHFGGLATGLVIGLFHMLTKTSYSRLLIEWILIPLLAVYYFVMPRYQVQYFQVFQSLFATEERMSAQSRERHTDEEFVKIYKANYNAWDSTRQLLDSISYIPGSLRSDTALLRGYIALAQKGFEYRITMLENESFIYRDSIEHINLQMRLLPRPEHIPFYRLPKESTEIASEEPAKEPVKVFYDSNWVETKNPGAPYYRIGTQDSLGNWDGSVTDYFANGDIQMKGEYKNGKRDGIFIFYTDHKSYASAGRYRDNISFGKWEQFHDNGKLKSEVFYRNRYFLKNLWDSSGQKLVSDGNGVETYQYPNGVVALSGQYINGYKEGYWVARYENGKTHYEENYFNGNLLKGRSFDAAGNTFFYDESSYFPFPERGHEKLKAYLKTEAKKVSTDQRGTVKLSFRISVKGDITELLVEKSMSPLLDSLAKQILLRGPRWIPGKDHGYEPADSYGIAEIPFGL